MRNHDQKRTLRMTLRVVAVLSPLIPIIWPSNHYLKVFATPLICEIGKILYDEWAQFYLWTTRLFFKLTNARVSWTMSAEYRGSCDPECLHSIASAIVDTYTGSVLWHDSDYEKIVKLSIGGAARVRVVTTVDALDEEDTIFHFQLTDYPVPFRDSDGALQSLVALFDTSIKPLVQPSREKYVLKVSFGDPNPYFGLFLRRVNLPKQELVAFHCIFTEKIGPSKETIQVSKDHIAVVTRSLVNLQALARRYITLAGLSSSNP